MNDAQLVRRLCSWFSKHARELPWRIPGESTRRDPYRTLVSELMLQQTQVSRVSEKFPPFIDRFPTVEDLAAAPEDEVLAMWSGLGYYRRARSLHAAAGQVVDQFLSEIPRSSNKLMELKGIGRYTAGAIASIAYDEPAPIVDGNVTRVVLRLEGRDLASDDAEAITLSWQRAEELVRSAQKSRAVGVTPGELNESLMELGATVCTPANPRCGVCPIRAACTAAANGNADAIPRPKAKAKRKPLYCATVICERDGKVLVRKRSDTGLWAGLYETPTLECDDRSLTSDEVAEGLQVRVLRELSAFTFLTTHRDVRFTIYQAEPDGLTGDWISPDQLDRIALSSAHRRVLSADRL